MASATIQHNQDADLARQARMGSRAAFDVLFQRHKPFVYNVCYRILGSADDAVDMTQAAFIQAYRELRKFKGDSAFRSWLYRIAVNLCISLVRREQRRRRLAEAMPDQHRDENTDPYVREAVLKLPPHLRTVLALFYFQGLSCEEAAEVLGCSEGAVRTRLHRARIAFKEKYEEMGK